MLRLFLPPNLIAAAARDAIGVKMELDLASPPPAALFPALALLQRWCGSGAPPKFLQLSRGQLLELVAALNGQPAFFWLNAPDRPIGWRGKELDVPGLAAAPSTPVVAPSSSPASSTALPAKKKEIVGTSLAIDGSEHFLAVTLPSREHSSYVEALELLKANGFVLEPSNRKWWLRDRHKTLNFLAQHLGTLRDRWGATLSPNFLARTAHLQRAEIATDVAEDSGGFAVTLSLDAAGADPDTVRQALAAGRAYLENGGRVVLLDAAKIAQLTQAQRALAGDPSAGVSARRTVRVNRARTAEAQEILESLSPGYRPPEAWSARSAALRDLSRLAPAPVPTSLDRQLRPYQRIGAAWLWHLHRSELGGILADEMGLGKTLQALGLLAAVHESRARSGATAPSLVVCPASLLENWRREAARFAPELRVRVHHGAGRATEVSEFAAFDLVVTSYGTLTRDHALFAGAEFACLIADEAQHIKNRRSQNAATLRALRGRSRFVLTGTPVENSLDDLRSLFEFLLPGYVDRVPAGLRGDERAWFDERLRAKAAPYLLRRTKQSVAPELPAKLEQVVWCELTPSQAALYRDEQQRSERELIDLAAGGANEGRLKLAALTQLLRLRQICCDPRLVRDGDNAATDSAKLEALRELLAEAIDDGHRVLVFSQFTTLLGLLRAELEKDEITHAYLDGSMPPRARQAEVDRFQSSTDIPVFLISLKAGGTGLTLTGADTVVHFDPWWNPAAEAQATDRAHRIGQTKIVTSYKLIASGTVEEKVLALQDSKRALLADVFEASAATAAKLSLDDLKALLE